MNKASNVSLAFLVVALSALTGACSSGAPRGSEAPRTVGQTIDDGTLTARVKTALIQDDRTKARQINVDVYQGEVQLNGFVDSETARNAAGEVAKAVQGVRSVRNNLQIRAASRTAGQVVDDATITTRVKTALIGDPRTKAYRIDVNTNAGVVQLGGYAESAESKQAAEELARAVPGVKEVNNDLRIKP